jgi:hypothetical protein
MRKEYVEHSARDVLAEMREGKSDAEYADVIWRMREPTPPAKSGAGWPYRSNAEIAPNNVTRLRK